MTRSESRSVQTGKPDLVEREPRREHGRLTSRVALRARALVVTRHAEISFARSSRTVLSREIAAVHQVTFGRGIFGRHIDVATVTAPHVPLPLMHVARKTHRHRRTQRAQIISTRVLMASHALAVNSGYVRRVIETQMLARGFGLLPRIPPSVAPLAGAWVVWFTVAIDASRGARKMKRVVRSLANLRVTLKTVDSLRRVRAMLESPLRRARLDAEYTGTSTE
jgi:hypothetical protein